MKTISLSVRGYKGQGFGSGFIKRFTFGEYSHVSLVFRMHGREEEFESIQGKGVITHPPHSAEDKEFVELAVPMNEEQVVNAHITAMSLLGAKYDWAGVWGFVRRKKRHSPDKWFCSEYVGYVLFKSTYPVSRREPYRETPSTVMESYQIG